MGMVDCPQNLNQFISGAPIFENTFPEEECEQKKFYGDCFHCFETSIAKRDKQLKQKVQSDYEARLKADMVAMLIELQNKINAIPINPDNSEAFRLGQVTAYDKSEDVIQQKINELKEGKEE